LEIHAQRYTKHAITVQVPKKSKYALNRLKRAKIPGKNLENVGNRAKYITKHEMKRFKGRNNKKLEGKLLDLSPSQTTTEIA
jgi:hypothetical protein